VWSGNSDLFAGTVDWGHLNADRVNMDPKYAQYDLVGATAEEVAPPRDAYGAGNLPPPPSAGLKKQQKLQKTGEMNAPPRRVGCSDSAAAFSQKLQIGPIALEDSSNKLFMPPVPFQKLLPAA